MTAKTLEEEAREAADQHYKELERAGVQEFKFLRSEGFLSGYLAAATARDKELEQLRQMADLSLGMIESREKEIEELRAKLASMREPIWMLREEHEREIEELRARVKELET